MTAQGSNHGRTPFHCTLWVSIHLSFNSQQMPPLSSLSGFSPYNIVEKDFTVSMLFRIKQTGCWVWNRSRRLQAKGNILSLEKRRKISNPIFYYICFLFACHLFHFTQSQYAWVHTNVHLKDSTLKYFILCHFLLIAVSSCYKAY